MAEITVPSQDALVRIQNAEIKIKRKYLKAQSHCADFIKLTLILYIHFNHH